MTSNLNTKRSTSSEHGGEQGDLPSLRIRSNISRHDNSRPVISRWSSLESHRLDRYVSRLKMIENHRLVFRSVRMQIGLGMFMALNNESSDDSVWAKKKEKKKKMVCADKYMKKCIPHQKRRRVAQLRVCTSQRRWTLVQSTYTHYLRGQEVQGRDDRSSEVRINLVKMFSKHMQPNEYHHTVRTKQVVLQRRSIEMEEKIFISLAYLHYISLALV